VIVLVPVTVHDLLNPDVPAHEADVENEAVELNVDVTCTVVGLMTLATVYVPLKNEFVPVIPPIVNILPTERVWSFVIVAWNVFAPPALPTIEESAPSTITPEIVIVAPVVISAGILLTFVTTDPVVEPLLAAVVMTFA
jgi:hypothetical protein